MNKRNLVVTICLQAVCWGVILGILLESNSLVEAHTLLQSAPTPVPFLGPIYYGRHDIRNIVDHDKPLASTGDDGNDVIMYYNGVTYAATPMPTNGYGYDEHGGVDYSLEYEPVLAGADGTVTVAGWHHPDNHRSGYGLYIQLDHGTYSTLYGHLSTLAVKTGDLIVADPTSRNSILGISGNTGSVFGGCADVGSDPLCGVHLHFEVREGLAYKPVDPYGWIGLTPMPSATPVVDPWSVDPAGATSYDLWENPPAIIENVTDQYFGGTPVAEPPVNIYLIEVDNSTPFLFGFGGCWLFDWNNPAGIQGNYAYSSANTGPCGDARWSFDPNALAPAGEYDVYAHIPDPATSLSAEYTIYHSGMYDTAIVVQAAYPNDNHDNWAYLGRYYFRMNGSNEYVSLNNQNLTIMTEDTGNLLIADAIRLIPSEPKPDKEFPVVASTDDAGLNYLCSYSVTHNEIYLGHCPDGTNIVSGFRFQNVSVPQGTAISAARIEFTVDGTFTTNIDVQFRGERVADAAAFSDTNRPSDRSPLTTAAATWHVGSEDEWLSWHTRHSPDLSAIIEEIVNQTDWVSGNDLVIIVQPSGLGTVNRRVFAWDRMDNALQTARLQLWYTETPPPTPPPAPTNLKAVYDDGMPGPGQTTLIPEGYIPMPHVGLSWKPKWPETGITFNVYRSTTSSVPVDAVHRIASGLDKGSYDDYDGQVGHYYVVTAVANTIESAPSNTARAR